MAVVWVGRDDDKTTGLTGASGAMTVWGEMMKNIQPEPLQPTVPEEIEMVNIDPVSGQRYEGECTAGEPTPFIKGSAPTQTLPCPVASTEIPKDNETPPVKAEAKTESKPEIRQEPGKKSWLQRIFN